jgi:hypothetical protein
MAEQTTESSARPLDDLSTGSTSDPISCPEVGQVFHLPEGLYLDWRTIDPSTIEGENILIEELRFYQENLEELMRVGAGQYVLIVGRQVHAYYHELEAAAREAERNFRGQSFLIKKVAWEQPIQTFGGIVG